MIAFDRRQAIYDLLKKSDICSMENLAYQFFVSRRTIIRDIEALSLFYPICTREGKHGGVYLDKSNMSDKETLKYSELKVLKEISPLLSFEQRSILGAMVKRLSGKNLSEQ